MNGRGERVTAQRRRDILQTLTDRGAVQVSDLTARFGVAPSTIRRDLDWLQEQGLARRVHGGALPTEPSEETEGMLLETLPIRIGKAAAELVQSGDTVFIGPGELTLAAARALAQADLGRLSVVTNGLAVARVIAARTEHPLILTGGQLERVDLGLGGDLAQAALRGLRADWVMLELSGVSAADGLADDSLSQAELARKLLDLGAQLAVLVEPDRVGRSAAAHIGPAADADVIITAREADSALLWDLTEAGVRVILT